MNPNVETMDPASIAGWLIGALAATGALFLAATAAWGRLRDAVLGGRIRPTLAQSLPVQHLTHDGEELAGPRGFRCRAYLLQGKDHLTMDPGERESLAASRQTALDRIAETGCTIRMLTLRTQQDQAPSLQEAEAQEAAEVLDPAWNPLKEVRRRWRKSFEGNIFENRHYLLLASKNGKGLDEAENALEAAMAEYRPLKLTALTSKLPGQNPLVPLRALFAIRPADAPALEPGQEIASSVVNEVLEIHPGGRIRLRNGKDEIWTAAVGLKKPGETVSEGMTLALSSLPGEAVIAHTLLPYSKAGAIAAMARESRAAASIGGGSAGRDRAQEVLAVLSGNHPEGVTGTLHRYGFNVILRAKTEERLEQLIRETERQITAFGSTPVREGKAFEAACFSALPGVNELPRHYRLLSMCPARLMIPQTAPSGIGKHDWGPEALTCFKTSSGNAYRFTFHVSAADEAVGHTLVIAPTGAGKTTLLCFLAAFVLNIPGARVWILDRKNGAEVFTRCAGGQYVRFDGEKGYGSAMNPFLLPDTRENRNYVKQFIAGLAGNPNPEDMVSIASLVELAYDEGDPKHRSLLNFYQGGFPVQSEAKRQLRKWVDEHQHGNVFNAPYNPEEAEQEDSASRLITYDCTRVFETPDLAPPVISLLTHRINEHSARKSSPALIFVDETEPMLKNPQFAARFAQGLQEGRKLRQVYVCCFQRPGAITAAGDANLILGQCKTQILMRNVQAEARDYEAFQLKQGELDFIRGRTHNHLTHAALLRRAEGESLILDTSLLALHPYLKVFASGTAAVSRLRRLTEAHGAEEGARQYIETE